MGGRPNPSVVEEKKKYMTVWGTGKPFRELIYVDDVADACIFFMNNEILYEKTSRFTVRIFDVFFKININQDIYNLKSKIFMLYEEI